MKLTASARSGALAAADALALRQFWPDLSALRHDLAGPQAWVDRVGADQAVCTLAAAGLWLVGLWLAAGLAAVLLGRLPGTVGLVARRFARAALPRALYRAAAGAAGLGVLLAPVAASAHTPGQGVPGQSVPGPSAPGPSVPGPSVPTPNWPTDGPPVPRLPAPNLPASPRSGSTRTTPAAPHPTLVRTGPAEVIVRSGDSLWQIAASRLGPNASDARIAAAWPRWWAANRAVIGPDPNHVIPGQVLHAPAERRTP